MMDTPVPIPNTEVKHHNGDDSTAVRQQQAAGSFFYFAKKQKKIKKVKKGFTKEEEYGKLSEHSREEERGFRKR